MTPEIASAIGSKDEKGALVATVVPGSPAAKAGFEQGDIVTALNGKTVEDSRDLTRRVANIAAGESASFQVDRQGKAMDIKVQIGARPDDKVASATPATPLRQNRCRAVSAACSPFA